jgi:signal transduction histidine kinase
LEDRAKDWPAMYRKRTTPVYVLLAALWLVVAGWQGAEHFRFRRVSYQTLLGRGREIASTLGVVIRSQGRFGMVRQSRLEAALEELARSTDLRAVMLLNAGGQVVASAGKPVGLRLSNLPRQAPRWDREHGLITIVDLVDLGSSAQTDVGGIPRAIVLPEEDRPPLRDGQRPRFPFPGPWGRDGRSSQTFSPPPFPPRPDSAGTSASRPALRPPFGGEGPGRHSWNISRPFWMDEERYQQLLKKRGLHGFVLQIPTGVFQAETRHDLWIRLTTVLIALLAAGGMAVAWRGAERMNQLQIRLLRASETNAHLRELNVAAAGLAHETRNPLNIVRGLAQIVSQSEGASAEIREKANVITEEVDRITGRLNQFISYSHTPEPRPRPTNLRAVVRDVERALESDQAEKAIRFETTGPDLTIEADESLLRQVVFNLLLNSYQAVGQGGRVEAVLIDGGRGEASLEIRDDGPGVPPELREEIYKPYFTTRAGGTGLGLAVVKQIALAHQWEIEYVAGESAGAVFRVAAMKIVRG